MSSFIHPCPGAKVSSPYGKRIIGGQEKRHQGIDLAKTGIVNILAAADGTVIRADALGTYGNVVIIQHLINGIRMDTTYAHLRDGSFKVKKGDKVKQGQVIGLMGNTGLSYGQHLHFEIHYGPWLTGQPNAIDPWPYISSPQINKMKISKEGLNLIKKWEGFQEKAYLCQANVWSIGYGTTKYANGKAVKQGDTINHEEALTLFEKQVNEHSSTIQMYVKVPLTQSQFDALASFQYNLGKHILRDSKLLEYLNNKEWDKACNQMLLYNKANGKVSTGLVNRRKEEVSLFESQKEDDEMVFSSPALKAETETTLSSKARRQMIIDEAVAAGANKSVWQEKLDNGTITDADLLGLAAKAIISKK